MRVLIFLLLFLLPPLTAAASENDLLRATGPGEEYTQAAGDTIRFQPELVPGLHRSYHIPWSDIKHPRLGLALSGGGARGMAHIGVLRALEEAGIEIDVIAGTSMGALVGGMYASGYSPDEIGQRLSNLSWQQYYFDIAERSSMFPGIQENVTGHLFQIRFRDFKPFVPSSVSSGQRFLADLLYLTKRGIYQNYKSWDQLKVDFRCVTTDLITGRRVVFSKGDLSEAIRASMSIPLLLAPVVWDSLLLVDGGLVENIPVETARAAGSDLVIAVDVTTGLRTADRLQHPWEIVDQISNLTITPRNRELLGQADLVISPSTSDWGSSDYSRMDELIALGYEATEAAVDDIKAALETLNSEPDQVWPIDTLFYTGARHTIPPVSPGGAGEISRHDIMTMLERIHKTGDYYSEEALLYTCPSGRRCLQIRLVENGEINALRIFGLPQEDSLRIVSGFAPFLGRPANFVASVTLLDQFIADLRQQGYSLAFIDSLHFDEGVVSLWVDRGRINEIIVTGNEHTSDYSILRDFKIKPGDFFNFYRAQSSITNIYASDLFASASYRIRQMEEGKTVELIVRERSFPLLQLGLGYDNRTFERVFLRLRHENSFDLGFRTVLYWRYSPNRIEQKFRLEQDRLFRTTLTWRIDLESNYNRWDIWSGLDKVGSASYRSYDVTGMLGQQIRRLGTISVGVRLTHGDYRENGEMNHYDLRQFMISSLVDTRDRVPWTENGEYHLVKFETSSSPLNPSDSFVRWNLLFKSWRRFLERHVVHSTVSLAQADEVTPDPYLWFQGFETGLTAWHTRQFQGRLASRLGLQYNWIMIDREAYRLLLMLEGTTIGSWTSNEDPLDLPGDLLAHYSAGLILDSILGPLELIYAYAPGEGELEASQRLTLNYGFHF